MSKLEEELSKQISESGLPLPQREIMFATPRRWRADFIWEQPHKVICEVEGGIFIQGRHNRGPGYQSDCEKGNRAQELGYKYLRVTGPHIASGYAIELLTKALLNVSLGLDGHRRSEEEESMLEPPPEPHPGSTPGESTAVV